MKFGLIGHPIEHSMSPTLFRAGYNGRYPYELIETPDLEEAYARFIQEYDGSNVRMLAIKYGYSEKTIRRIIKESVEGG